MLRFSPNTNRAHLIPWLEWEDEAFRRAQAESKPVLLFLSAFWCGYCQRMDEQALSERENLALLSAYFVPLRMENAKRPDVDARYNLNGWPTVVFLAPQGQLLAAVNYLPAEEFKNLLLDVHLSYQQRQGELSSAPDVSLEDAHLTAPDDNDRRLSAALDEITAAILAQADRQHGGYGRGQKFIQADANEFLLGRYEATKDATLLEHVCLTLDRMRQGDIHDRAAGGYFRTTTGADWSQPHREKLLAEQAGLLSNCLHLFRLTQRAEYGEMAREIVDYLDGKLFDPQTGGFFGCEDFLRRDPAARSSSGEFYSIVDECLYVDANATALCAYLDAAVILNHAACATQALAALEFIWAHCRGPDGNLCHYYDGAAHVSGWLIDFTRLGMALLRAHEATGRQVYLERAKELAEFVLAHFTNPAGGYFDLVTAEPVFLKSRLTAVESNGLVASFFLALAARTAGQRYRDAARWALGAFAQDLGAYGIHAAACGSALNQFVNR